MEREIITFLMFGGLAVLFNSLEDRVHTLKELEGLRHWLFHPNMLHTLRDYSIHLAVYSGYILGSH